MRRTLHLLLTAAFSGLLASVAMAQFGPSVNAFVSEAGSPYQLKVCDIDGDGDQDIVMVILGRAYGWHNDGAGNFGLRQPLYDGSATNDYVWANSALEIVDLNGDGIMDLLATTNWYAGLGGGTFSTSGQSVGMVQRDGVRDFDGDGDMDLLVSTANGLTLKINNGNGNFTVGQVLGGTALFIDFKDVNGDGLPDLLIGADGQSRWHANLGGGVFGPQNPINDTQGIRGLLCGDVDGDGDNDLVITRSIIPRLRWLSNNGTGNFTEADTISQSIGADYAAADVDGDGDLDFAATSVINVRWWSNTGSGTAFTQQVVEDFNNNYTTTIDTQYSLGDLDGDGDLDLVAANEVDVMGWYPNLGNGTWGPRRQAGMIMGMGSDVCAVDIDLDGDLDLVASASFGRQATWYPNNGDGTFEAQRVIQDHLTGLGRIRSADLNADGLPDLLTSSVDAPIIWNHNGGSSWSVSTLDGPGVSRAEADLDGDLDVDLVGWGGWYENDGSGNFTWHVDPLIDLGSVKIADMNGDGTSDIVLGTATSWTVLLNDGSMGLTTLSGNGTLSAFAVGDADNDGDIDAFAMGQDLVIRGYFNDGTGNLTEQVLYTNTTLGTRTILMEDINGDGYPDAVWALNYANTHQIGYNLNLGNGMLGPMSLIDPSASGVGNMVLADLNNDAVPDLVTVRMNRLTWQENHFFNAFRLRGSVFLDFDVNATLEPTDQKVPYRLVRTDANNVLVWTNSAGDYDLPADTGTWQVWHTPSSMYQITNTPDTLTANLTAQMPIASGLDFGLIPALDNAAQTVSIVGSGMRCNTEQNMWFHLSNNGTFNPLGITVYVELDPDLTIGNVIPTPDSISANHIYWHVDSLGWFQTFTGVIQYTVGEAGSMAGYGYQVNSSNQGLISAVSLYSEVVSCAFDPNDISVDPKGYGAAGAIPINTPWLEYTIRFQNTGNDTAFTVQLLDALDTNLDPRTMEVLAASHALTQIQVDTNNVALFRFQQILLPDSIADEPGSHGFVKYRIKPVEGLPHGTEITNSAGIYFDLNAPVLTNTVLNTLVDCDLFTASITVMEVDELHANTGDAYQWSLNGATIPGATSADLTLTANGEYTVQVTSAFGCQALSDPYTFLSTGIVASDLGDLSIEPNPATSYVVLRSADPLSQQVRIRLLDMHGRMVREWRGNESRTLRIERDGLPEGSYMIQVDGPFLHRTLRVTFIQ